MARLAELKPSALKIDGQFVRDHEGDGDRIIRSILGLARAFGLHATAEFVETDAQREYLRGLGCDALQGYGIAEPMPASSLLAWTAERSS
jgi:EAL domain-containing protein (putative c-di-GMP-specific phosphodiesterase class I)